MVSIGNFFFKNRNWVFVVFYAALFIPSPRLFSQNQFGDNYYLWPICIGLLVTVSGQLVRGLTIGLAYIIRGGKQGKPYAEDLVTEGIFRHCRNPLYAGNILMLLGIGILANSLLYVTLVVPIFIFIYQSIVMAEEQFLYSKFGSAYNEYKEKVNRWWPQWKGLSKTWAGMHFNWQRWILKEHTTQFIWLCGIVIIILLEYEEFMTNNKQHRNIVLIISLLILAIGYALIRYLKKTGKFTE